MEGTNFKNYFNFLESLSFQCSLSTECFTPNCMAGLASPDKGVTKTYHLRWWGPWMCFRASQCKLFVQEMATCLCRGCENFRSCTIWKKFQVFQLLYQWLVTFQQKGAGAQCSHGSCWAQPVFVFELAPEKLGSEEIINRECEEEERCLNSSYFACLIRELPFCSSSNKCPNPMSDFSEA